MDALLKTENVKKRYRRGGASGPEREPGAVDGVSLTIFSGTTLALVGPSGSGKSSLARCMSLLEPVSSGKIWFAGREVTNLTERERRAVRPNIQMVFQDPANSLNPRMSALELVMEPLEVQKRGNRGMLRRAAGDLLGRVGLRPENMNHRARECSGGQRQRIAIARALALGPRLLILDEALSALDCSVQAHIANLLLELQTALGLTYVFITHDMTMAAHLADEIAVMERGRVVEMGAAARIVSAPRQAVTQRLLLAARAMNNVADAPRAV
ncbi:MAG: dipeptide/oligopeptide/nickel ABC transporter ATP-binding protein [Candidatus Acidiferrum sp.]